MFTPQFIEEMKNRLNEEKAHIEQELQTLHSHTEMGDDEDENAEEVNVDEVAQDVKLQLQTDLEKIDKALKKIDEGTYGIDDDGKEIAEERLRALPWADKAI